ncbi:MAG: 4-hydroxythreonine-4-phosphate dehydrogenase PdxA [Lautropia sp.]|nr:4-hydroxythreonine-4-phosphate dehydrogenase PdxA [Lautropia sp.]
MLEEEAGLIKPVQGATEAVRRPIGITMGDPAGIGPELVVKALHAASERGVQGPFVVYGHPESIHVFARRHGAIEGLCELVACGDAGEVPEMGKLSAVAGDLAFQAVRRAALDAGAGKLRAVVTAPLSKAAMNLAGHVYPGHTEILAELAGGVPVRMMLANESLRTVLASIHVPLIEAIRGLSTAGILETIRLTEVFLKRTGIAAPRIAVAGLNPHAGEGGLIGREEIEIIAPAVEAAQAEGIDATGPWPPDTVFMRARGFAEFDVVIAMYHDQGLIPVKYLGLDEGVNLTVGLPYVRTSPDHGTAFDIAGQGVADPASMLAALRMADRLSRCA